MVREPLPIDALLPDLVARVRERGCAVVTAETGAGKTTRVPPALLDAGLADLAGERGARKVVVLEPRRIAARAAARRIAAERGVRLGEEVGYHVRFDRVASARTRLLVVTEGLLTRMLLDDPFLSDVGVVLFDEFHERSLHADLALALVERVRRDARPDLRVVVMSATLDVAPVAQFLGGASGPAPHVTSPGRAFPVDVEHVATKRDDRLEDVVADVVSARLASGADVADSREGDVLVFLPGVGEIRRCGEALSRRLGASSVELVELHGELPPEQQDAAIDPRDGDGGRAARRRVVLATNVAETSITLPRVTTVVDSGLVRRMQFDPASGLDRLELGRVSKASAEQRRGRAGRVAPGVCVRLWSALDQRGLDDAEVPEIRRVDVAGLALELFAFGERDLASFRFLEAPEPARLARAVELLLRLGAVRAVGPSGHELTTIGRAMAELPVHPRLARLLVEGRERGVARRAALAAALLSERDPFLREPRSNTHGMGRASSRRVATHDSDSDVLDRVAALEEFASRGTTSFEFGELHRGRAEFVLRGAEQLARIAGATGATRGRGRPSSGSRDDDDSLLRSLFVAFPDRLVRRRESAPRDVAARDRTAGHDAIRGVMAGGRGVRLADESAVRRAELFVAIDVDAAAIGREDALVRSASLVRREWLDESGRVQTGDELRFDRDREALVARRVTRFDDLVLDERPLAVGDVADGGEAARLLAEAASVDVARALALERDDVASFVARVRRLRDWLPELALPELDDAFFRTWLPDLCVGAKSFTELRKLPLVELLRARLGHRLARTVDELAPERLVVPSGSAIRLDYANASERGPVLAVKVQELFGLAQTPRVAGGRVAVVLHLLAPSGRPQQVTQDLASFWDVVYPKIRGELRARYPKHAWPDDPRAAVATRGPKRRGRS
jgi:ATP-dependent helicase HrpB